MKVLAVLLVCALAAVQGRSTGEINSKALAARGDAPHLVHLRIAIATSGFLNSAIGSLISDRWVLTSTGAVDGQRFIWIRYGAPTVISPELVTETSAVRTSGYFTLISINRAVEATPNIAPIELGAGSASDSTSLYVYGQNDDGQAGESLYSIALSLVSEEGSIIASSDEGTTTNFDLGAPLVVDGKQIAVLVTAGSDDNAGVFEPLDGYLDWIQSETGVSSRAQDDSVIVHFVN